MLCTNVLKCYEHLVPLEWYVFVTNNGIIFLCSNFGNLHKFISRESFEKYTKEHKIEYICKNKLPNYRHYQSMSEVVKL